MYTVFFEETGKSKPRPHERRVAKKMAIYFKSDISFIRRRESKTPDLYIIRTGVRWELKSPEGGGKHTIQNNLRGIDVQSENVLLDLTRSKLADEKGITRTKEFLKTENNRVKRLKIILKTGDVLTIKGK